MDNNSYHFTAADIEKYHKGLLSSKERHALEKAALDDPFLADALEGYAVAGVNASSDLSELRERLANRTSSGKVIPIQASKQNFPWFRAAVAILFLAGASLITYQLAFKNKGPENNIAQVADTASTKAQAPVDSNSTKTEENELIADLKRLNTDTASTWSDNNLVANKQTTKRIPVSTNAYAFATTDTLKVSNNVQLFNIVGDSSIAYYDQIRSAPVAAPSVKEGIANIEKKQAERDSDGVADRFDDEDAKAKNANVRAARAEQFYKMQGNIYRGRVTDNNNNGIPFANVTNLQDNVGTYTDARGFFNLTSPDSVLNVQTRALGFNNYNVQLRNNKAETKVVMKEDESVAAQTLSQKKINYARRANDSNFKLEGEPEPEDGWDTYDSYLANNVIIPKEYKQKDDGSAIVEISFEVDSKGKPIKFKVEKSLCSSCDQEAIRLIEKGPKWKRKARKARTRVAISF